LDACHGMPVRCLLVMPHTLLSLYGIIYVIWFTSHLPKLLLEPDSGSFQYTRYVTTIFTAKHLPTKTGLKGHRLAARLTNKSFVALV